MKTFKEFLIEANTTQRLAARALELVNVHLNDPDKFKVYLNLLKKAQKEVLQMKKSIQVELRQEEIST